MTSFQTSTFPRIRSRLLGGLATVSLLALGLPGVAQAQGQCAAEISGNDAMKFDKATMSIPASCKTFTVTLKHTGKLPKAAMGHNWVLTKAADQQPVVTEAIAAGAANDYLKPGDARVLAHTKLIGGGESASVEVDVSKLKAGEAYAYFCSFPGHAALMKGTLTVTP